MPEPPINYVARCACNIPQSRPNQDRLGSGSWCGFRRVARLHLGDASSLPLCARRRCVHPTARPYLLIGRISLRQRRAWDEAAAVRVGVREEERRAADWNSEGLVKRDGVKQLLRRIMPSTLTTLDAVKRLRAIDSLASRLSLQACCVSAGIAGRLTSPFA